MTILNILSQFNRVNTPPPSLPVTPTSDDDVKLLLQEMANLRKQVARLEDEKRKSAAENVKLLTRLCISEKESRAKRKSLLPISVDADTSQIPSPPSSSPDVSMSGSSSDIPFSNSAEGLYADYSKELCEVQPSEDMHARESQSNVKLLSVLFATTRTKNELAEALCAQGTFSRQLLIQLLSMRKQLRTQHAKMEAKTALIAMVNNLHRSRREALEVSHEQFTNLLLTQLLALRKFNSQLMIGPKPSGDNYDMTRLRLSEAELRAEKESLAASLQELIRTYMSEISSQRQNDEPPINELVLGIVMAWKASQSRKAILEKLKNKQTFESGPVLRLSSPPQRFPLPSRLAPTHRKVQGLSATTDSQRENVRPPVDGFSAFRRHPGYVNTNNHRKHASASSHTQVPPRPIASSLHSQPVVQPPHKSHYANATPGGRRVFTLHNDTASGLSYLRYTPNS